jgi:hypothetical protein
MKRTLPALLSGCLALLLLAGADTPAKRSPREAFREFNELIGSWRATGLPEVGTAAQKRQGFWTETVAWSWKFKGDDAWLALEFTKGKHWKKGELHALPEQNRYRLSLENTAGETQTFEGSLEKHILSVERTDERTKETQRFVLTPLHETRFLYRYEVKPAERSSFTVLYKVGATREGVAFASGDSRPECIVSGGLGTIKVMYRGKEYHVCCGGCRDAFNDNPEKFIALKKQSSSSEK